MAPTVQTVIYPVHDLAHAKALFSALLEAEPVMDAPYYVGYRVGEQDIGLDPNGHAKGVRGPLPYWHVADIHTSLERLVAAGATVQQAINDVGGGKLLALVNDADGNTIGLIQPA